MRHPGTARRSVFFTTTGSFIRHLCPTSHDSRAHTADRGSRHRFRLALLDHEPNCDADVVEPANAFFRIHLDAALSVLDESGRDPHDQIRVSLRSVRIFDNRKPGIPRRRVVHVKESAGYGLGCAVGQFIVRPIDEQSAALQRLGGGLARYSMATHRRGCAHGREVVTLQLPWSRVGMSQASLRIMDVDVSFAPVDRFGQAAPEWIERSRNVGIAASDPHHR